MKTCMRIMTASKRGDFVLLVSKAGVMYLAEVRSIRRDGYYGNIVAFQTFDGVKYCVI